MGQRSVVTSLRSRPVFLLDSANGCQGFQETKCIMVEELLAVLNLYVLIEIRVVAFDTNHFITDSTQAINHCFNPEAS